jgi:hypothetical protein
MKGIKMNPNLTPTNFLEFFQGNLPELFSEDKDILPLIEQLRTTLADTQRPEYYHTNILEKGKCLIEHIIRRSIEFLSDESNSPKDKAIATINNYICDFSKFEELLFGLNPQYRDHTIHSLWVYLLGHRWIISMGGYGKIKLSGQISIFYANRGEKKFVLVPPAILGDKPHFEAMWCIIALLHDVGYPVQEITNKPNEVFGRILEPFAIDFHSVFQPDLGSRITLLHQSICDLLSKVYRPKGLTQEEEKKYFEEASNKEREGVILPIVIIRDATTSKDESLEMEFKIASVDKIHSAWSAIFAFKHIPYLHESDFRGGGSIDYEKLLTRRDILYSIVHHTIDEPKDNVVNRFQFILLLMDDVEEIVRFGRGGVERGIFSDYCAIQKFDADENRLEIILDYTAFPNKAEDMYLRFCQRYKTQTQYKINNNTFEILIIFKDEQFTKELSLALQMDREALDPFFSAPRPSEPPQEGR